MEVQRGDHARPVISHALHEVQQAPTRVARYEAPASVDDALAQLSAHRERALIVAGGTDVMVELDRAHHGEVEVLIDVSRLHSLATIDVQSDGSLRLGALVTHAQVVASSDCAALATVLQQACREVGSPALRNRATVVGNVVTASPANDTLSALVVLDAQVELRSARGDRSLAIADFITGFRSTDLAADEMVTAITVPPRPAGFRSVWVKAGLRKAQAISVVHAAVGVELDSDRQVVACRAALGSVGPTVLEVDLTGAIAGSLNADAIAAATELAVATATPISDLRAPAEYRSELVATIVTRALRSLADAEPGPPEQPAVRLWAPEFDGRWVSPATDTVVINGQPHTVDAAGAETLLDWLRSTARMTGVKEGCAEGECGACTVTMDDAAVLSCLVPAQRAGGTRLTTVEGLADAEQLAPIQQGFVDCGAVQCGYCTPGLLVAAQTMLDEAAGAALDREAVRLGLSGNLCRCTGYQAIENAVDTAVAISRANRT